MSTCQKEMPSFVSVSKQVQYGPKAVKYWFLEGNVEVADCFFESAVAHEFLSQLKS